LRDLERCSQYRPQNWTILRRDVDDVLDHCLCTDSGLLTAIKLPSMHPKARQLSTMEAQGLLAYIVDSARRSWIAFCCVVSSSDYESAALPLSYLGPCY